jgi:glutaminyl-tRNA synthetase
VALLAVPPQLLALRDGTPHAPAAPVLFFKPTKASEEVRFGSIHLALAALKLGEGGDAGGGFLHPDHRTTRGMNVEHDVRDDLNKTSPRFMAVLDPIKLVITNYPEGQTENLEAQNNPEDPAAGSRSIPFSKTLLIERDDFIEEAPKKYFRLTPGQEVRLRWAYYVTCTHCVKDATGKVTEVHCTYDPATKGGDSADGRKVKGTIHWVSAAQALSCEVRVYDRLFSQPDPDAVPEGQDFISTLNPHSLVVIPDAKIEPSVANDPIGSRYQFERTGYFMSEVESSTPEKLVFNRIVGMRDSWAKEVKRG